jgi:peptide/nickel transport system permease protein
LVTFLVRRVVLGCLTVLLVASAIFAIFYVLPGAAGRRPKGGVSAVAVLMAGRQGTIAQLRGIDRDLGLNRPLPVQYEHYIAGLARGDLGYSWTRRAPVIRVLAPAIPASASIAVGASLVWLAAGVAIGIVATLKRGSRWDRIVIGGALAGQSVPVFVVSLLALSLLFRYTGIYAGNRYVPLSHDPVQWLEAMWLPWICLALLLTAVYARMVRGSLLEVKGEDYIRTSVAKGLRERDIVRHEVRAGLTPVVTMYGLDVGVLLGGSVIIEQIFNIPGLGSLLLTSRDFYDFPVMAGVVTIGSVAVIVANMVIDVVYAALDPRVRL